MTWQCFVSDVLSRCCRDTARAIMAWAIVVSCLATLTAKEDDRAAKQVNAAAAPEGIKSLGFSIRLTLPINDQTTNRVKRFVSGALEKALAQKIKPYLIFEFYVPPSQENFGRDSNFGASYELAHFLTSDELN